MGVEREEIAKLSINDPARGTIGILAFDAEDRLLVMHWMQAVAYSNPEAMEEDRNTSMILLVAFKP